MHNARVMISVILLACLSHLGQAQDAVPQAVESSSKQQPGHSTSETERRGQQSNSSSAGVLGLLPADTNVSPMK
jgi:hypothetical protein